MRRTNRPNFNLASTEGISRHFPIALRFLVRFEESNGNLEFEALKDAGFVLGSAIKRLHDLVLGHYSAHTNQDALVTGEARIAEIGRRLKSEGRL
jgi:hypothetical protein